jgi:hypothetical protein
MAISTNFLITTFSAADAGVKLIRQEPLGVTRIDRPAAQPSQSKAAGTRQTADHADAVATGTMIATTTIVAEDAARINRPALLTKLTPFEGETTDPTSTGSRRQSFRTMRPAVLLPVRCRTCKRTIPQVDIHLVADRPNPVQDALAFIGQTHCHVAPSRTFPR